MGSSQEHQVVHTPGLRQWYQTSVGRKYQQEELRLVSRVLAKYFRKTVLQVGRVGWESDIRTVIKFAHYLVLDQQPDVDASASLFGGHPEAFPIDTHSIDIVVLPHVLEYAADPHQVLREVERVLKPEGIVLLLGFNPWSIWHVPACLPKMRQRYPWNGKFIGRYRVHDWLNVLNFDVESSRGCCPVPFLGNAQNSVWRRRLLYRMGSGLPCLSADYFMMAVKRVAGATPISLSWKLKSGMVNPLTEPTVNSIHEPTHSEQPCDSNLYRRRLPRKPRHRRLGRTIDL